MMTFAEQAKMYITQIQSRKRAPAASATVRSYESKLNRWLVPFFGNKPFSEIDNGLVRVFVQKLSNEGLSASTINVIFNILKQIVASAVDENGNRLYERSWNVEFIDMPIISSSDQKSPCAPSSLVQKAINEASGQYKALYALLAGSGLRIGEALALRVGTGGWDPETGTIAVNSTVVRGHIQPFPKTEAGKRQIDLAPELNEFLKSVLNPVVGEFVFKSTKNTLLRETVIYRNLEKAGIPGFHSLRRFRVTYLEQNSVPRSLIKFWIGHKAADISEKYMKFGDDMAARKSWASKVGTGFAS